MKTIRVPVTAVVLLVLARSASAQFNPQYFYTSSAIQNAYGITLPGNNTNNQANCGHFADGCLVQILSVGSNNIAHLPDLNGEPTGGDSIQAVSYIGDGISACSSNSGQFSSAFYPRPANGTLLYGRVFDAPALSNATHWGQSATFSVSNSAVMDVSVLGLKLTSMPLGENLMTTFDGKGQTYYTDLIANLNPLNPNDVFGTSGLISNSQVTIQGHVGRVYTLQRSTDLTVPNGWTDITSVGPLSAGTSLILADPSPPNSTAVFYRVQVTMP